MGFLKKLFSTKKIISVEVVSNKQRLSEQEKMDNRIVGHIESGSEGDVYNSYNATTTTFKVNYDDGTYKMIEVEDSSSKFNYYIQFLD